MIRQLRNSAFTKVLWGIMGLYLLNISADSPDANPNHIPEDLSFNDQESIIEIVVEKMLGYENAIKEYDDNDTEDHNNKTSLNIDLIAQHNIDTTINQCVFKTTIKNFPTHTTFLTNGFHQLDTPPPKI